MRKSIPDITKEVAHYLVDGLAEFRSDMELHSLCFSNFKKEIPLSQIVDFRRLVEGGHLPNLQSRMVKKREIFLETSKQRNPFWEKRARIEFLARAAKLAEEKKDAKTIVAAVAVAETLLKDEEKQSRTSDIYGMSLDDLSEEAKKVSEGLMHFVATRKAAKKRNSEGWTKRSKKNAGTKPAN